MHFHVVSCEKRFGKISPVSWQYVEPKSVKAHMYLPYTQRAQVYIWLVGLGPPPNSMINYVYDAGVSDIS